MFRLLLPLAWVCAFGCASQPIRRVKLAPDVDLSQKTVLICAWSATPLRELICMTPADAALALPQPKPEASLR
jgi:hypothetical protein